MNPALTGIKKEWKISVGIGGNMVTTFNGPLESGGVGEGGTGLPAPGTDPDKGPNQSAKAHLNFSAETGGVDITYNYQQLGSGPIFDYAVGINLTVKAGPYGDNCTNTTFFSKTFTGPGFNEYATMEYLFSGTVTFDINTEEYIVESYSPTTNEFYAGVPDSPVLTNAKIWERIHDVTVTAVMQDGTASAYFEPNTWIDMGYFGSGYITDAVASDATTGSWTIDAGSYPYPDWPTEASSITTSLGSGSFGGWCNLTITPENLSIITGSVGTSTYMNNQVGISASVFAMENTYPGEFNFLVGGVPGTTSVIGSGGASASGVQFAMNAGGTVDTVGYVATNNQALNYGKVNISIDPLSLTANGEDYSSDEKPLQTRLLIRGQSAPGMSASFDSTYAEPAIGSWPSAAASVTRTYSPEWASGSYAYLQLVLTGYGGISMPGTITIPPCSTGVNLHGIGGSAETDVYPGPATPMKTWGFTTGSTDGDPITVKIPLFAPDNLSASPDTQDTDWPLPARRPLYSGVWRIPSITVALSNPSSEQTVEVTSATLLRSTAPPNVNFLPTWYHSVYSVGGETTDSTMTPDWPVRMQPDQQVSSKSTSNYYARRGMLVIQDGIQSLEECDMWYVYTYGGGSDTPSYQFFPISIADLVAQINAIVPQYDAGGTVMGHIPKHPGYAALAHTGDPFTAAPYPDDLPPSTNYYDSSLPASSINGSGLLRYAHTDSHGAPYWTFGPAFDLQSIGAIAQPLYDSLFTHPGWNGFDQVTYNGQIYGGGVYAGGILRAEAHGQVIQAETPENIYESGEPGVSVTLRVNNATGSVVGTATTDATGFYHTSGPAGHAGNVAHWVQLTGESADSYNYGISAGQWWSRHRHRVAFLGPPPCCSFLQTGDPLTYFPFAPQMSDPNTVPTEEWRRVGGGPGFGEQSPSAASTDSTGAGASEGEATGGGNSSTE